MGVLTLIRTTIKEFLDDDSPRFAAAISYYAIFSLPVILVSIIWLVGSILGRDAAQGVIEQQLRSLMGEAAARQVQTAIRNVRSWGSGGTLTVLLAVAGFTYGLTGGFLQLQAALNNAWEVRPEPWRRGVWGFLIKRLLSLLLVLLVAVLLVAFFGATAILSAFGNVLGHLAPPWLTALLLTTGNWLVSVGVTLVLLAAVFKLLPDAIVDWRDIWPAAAGTALLFNLGKYLIAIGVGALSPVGLFGAAGSLIIVMIWINLSVMIVLLGAEFIQVRMRARGVEIRPARGAVRVPRSKSGESGA